MSVYLVMILPVADKPDPETATGIAREVARIGGTKAPWRQIDITGTLHDTYALTLRSKSRVADLKAAFPNMIIVCRWRRVDGFQNTTDRMKKARYLKIMPLEGEAQIEPATIKQILIPHGMPNLDLSET